MSNIVGCIIVSKKDNKVLLLRRSMNNSSDYYRGYWSFLTGHIDEGELPYQAMEREIEEEIGVKKSTLKLNKFTSYVSGKNNHIHFYYTLVPEEFTPTLNKENMDYMWCDRDDLPEPLYPGVQKKIDTVLTLI